MYSVQAKNPNQQRPNIIFIMSDDHAAHAISAYGSTINKTPHIDRLAREGIRFENCFCTNSICAPSRAVILTGKYSHLNGVMDNRIAFDGTQQTLPKLLQQAGYQTAIVGKWHLKSSPTGFHYSNILPDQGIYHNPVFMEEGIRKEYKGYVTDIITDLALKWMREHKSSAKPFFLMLHHKAPHANWVPDKKHLGMYTDRDIPFPDTFNDDYRTRSAQIKNHRLHVGPNQWDLHFKRFGQLPGGKNEQEIREWVYQKYMKNYLRCVASVDDNIGRVLDFLDQNELTNNTIVIYTSDQGFFLGDHGLYDKRFMYEQALRMPLLIRYPNKISAGSVSNALLLNLDFASTILDYADAPIPGDLQGRSFKSISYGIPPKGWRPAIYYRFYEQAFGIGPHEGIRTMRYKLIHFLYGDKGWELYDLQEDPDELVNIYESASAETITKNLKENLVYFKKKYGDNGEDMSKD
jgi:arylsulfatase A-like enzyme